MSRPTRVAPDVAHRVGGRDVAAALADRDDQLDLVVQVLGQARVRHPAGLALGDRQHRVGRLHEEERRLAAGEAHLLRVLDVVAADAVDAVHREGARRAAGDGNDAAAGAGDDMAHGDGFGCDVAVLMRPMMPRRHGRRATATLAPCSTPRSIKHCRACGGAVRYATPADDNRDRATCPVCTTIHYENPLNVVGTLPVWDDKVLLCRRNIEPRYGLWTLPAGFMELGETTAQGALRETVEEAGARVELRGPVHACSTSCASARSICSTAPRLLDTDFAPGPETIEAQLFREDRGAVGRDRVPHRARDARALLRRPPQRGAFGVHCADIG